MSCTTSPTQPVRSRAASQVSLQLPKCVHACCWVVGARCSEARGPLTSCACVQTSGKQRWVSTPFIARQFSDTSTSWREGSLHGSLSKHVSVCRLRLATCQQPFRRLGVATCCHRAVCARVRKSTENVNMLLTCQGHYCSCVRSHMHVASRQARRAQRTACTVHANSTFGRDNQVARSRSTQRTIARVHWISRVHRGLKSGQVDTAQPVDGSGSHGWCGVALLWLQNSVL